MKLQKILHLMIVGIYSRCVHIYRLSREFSFVKPLSALTFDSVKWQCMIKKNNASKTIHSRVRSNYDVTCSFFTSVLRYVL